MENKNKQVERVVFDFTKTEDVFKLEEILYFSNRNHLSCSEMETNILFKLLELGGIQVYRSRYTFLKEFDEDTIKKARLISDLLKRRSSDYPVQTALKLFEKYEPELCSNEFNALFYSEAKMFVRFNDITPCNLLMMLERSDCDKVVAFPSYCETDTGSSFYAFKLRMPRENFNEILQNFRNRQTELIREALQKMNDNKE